MASGNNASIILTIFGFYVIIGVVFGLIGSASLQSQSFDVPTNPDSLGFLGQIGYFFSGIGFTLGALPAWANTILFLPLTITLLYIILSYFRGSS